MKFTAPRPLLALALTVSILQGPAHADDTKEPAKKPEAKKAEAKKMGAKSVWQSDYQTALKMAQKNKKPLLVKFSSTWCGTCTQMAKGPLVDKEVLSLLSKDMVCVALDVDKHPQITKRFRIAGLPTLLVMSNSEIISKRSEQFVDTKTLLRMLRGAKKATDKAESDFQSLLATAQTTKTVNSAHKLGDHLRQNGNLFKAHEAYRMVLDNSKLGSGDRQKAGIRATNCLILIARFDDALKLADATIAIDPKDSLAGHAQYLKGYALEQAGQPDKARAAYEALVKAYPGSKAAQHATARIKALTPKKKAPASD